MRYDRRHHALPVGDQFLSTGRGTTQACPRLALTAHELLDQVVAAGNARDLDMAIFRLRDFLLRLLTEGCSPADMAGLLPVLSRMAALDRAYDCHLCSGLQHLMDRAARASGTAFSDGAQLRAYVEGVARSGAFVAHPDARCDWSRALGLCGRT